jgi:hypothetical protein
MKIQITNRLSNGQVIRNEHTIEQGNVYIELNGYTYYIDSDPDETIIHRWETDSDADYCEEPKGWKDFMKDEFKFLTK